MPKFHFGRKDEPAGWLEESPDMIAVRTRSRHSLRAGPVMGEEALNLTRDPIYEYACHEGNYAMRGILAGAREEEKAGREMAGNRGQVRDEGE